jgi:hypothetical protein
MTRMLELVDLRFSPTTERVLAAFEHASQGLISQVNCINLSLRPISDCVVMRSAPVEACRVYWNAADHDITMYTILTHIKSGVLQCCKSFVLAATVAIYKRTSHSPEAKALAKA